jgi:hypothetical protein
MMNELFVIFMFALLFYVLFFVAALFFYRNILQDWELAVSLRSTVLVSIP